MLIWCYPADELHQYLKYVATLEYDEEPNYNKLRKIFQDGLRKRRFSDDGKSVKFRTGGSIEAGVQNGNSEEGDELRKSQLDEVKKQYSHICSNLAAVIEQTEPIV